MEVSGCPAICSSSGQYKLHGRYQRTSLICWLFRRVVSRLSSVFREAYGQPHIVSCVRGALTHGWPSISLHENAMIWEALTIPCEIVTHSLLVRILILISCHVGIQNAAHWGLVTDRITTIELEVWVRMRHFSHSFSFWKPLCLNCMTSHLWIKHLSNKLDISTLTSYRRG